VEEDELPEAYAVLLRLRSRGASDGEIAAALAVPLEAVPALSELADRKRASRSTSR
jgi:hypothetical protein